MRLYYKFIVLLLCNSLAFCKDSSEQVGMYSCFPKEFYDLDKAQCSSCPQKCENCYGEDCLTCSIGLAQNSQCISSPNCPKGFFLNKQKQACIACILPFCMDCSSSTKCISCEKGFYLSKNSQCEKDSKTSVTNSFIQTSCPSRFEVNNGDCKQEQMCSSKSYRIKQHFELDIIQTLIYKSVLIGISNQEIIVYDQNSFAFIQTLFELPYSEDEYIFGATLYKNTLNILTQQNIYTFSLDDYYFLSKFSFNKQSIASDLNIKSIYASETTNTLTYLSLTNQSQNINCLEFNITYSDEIFNLSLIITESSLLLNKDNKITIAYYTFFEQISIVGIIQIGRITFVNLQNQSFIEEDIPQLSYSSFSLTSTQQISKDGLIEFFVTLSLNLDLFLSKIIYKISKSGIDSLSILPLQKPLPVFQQTDVFFALVNVQSINDQIFILIIYSSITDGTTEAYLHIYLSNMEYYFSLGEPYYNSSFNSSVIFSFSKKPDSATILDKSYSQNINYLLLMSYESKIVFFELDEPSNKALKFNQEIPFQVQRKQLILNNLEARTNSKTNKNNTAVMLFQYGTLLGKINLPIVDKQITILMNKQNQFISKKEIFFNNVYISFIVIASPMSNKRLLSNKISFILLAHVYSHGFSVIQLEQKRNGQQSIKGYKFFYAKFDELFGTLKYAGDFSIRQESCYDEINQVLYVVTNIGIYTIRFNSLDLIYIYPFDDVCLRDDSVFVHTLIEQKDYQYTKSFIAIQYTDAGVPDYQTKKVLLQLSTYYNIPIQNVQLYLINKFNRSYTYLLTHDQLTSVFLYLGDIQCYVQDKLNVFKDVKFYSDSSMITIQEYSSGQVINKFDFTSCFQYPRLLISEQYKYFLPENMRCILIEYSRYSMCVSHYFDFFPVEINILQLSLIDWDSFGTGGVLIEGVLDIADVEVDGSFEFQFKNLILLQEEEDGQQIYQLGIAVIPNIFYQTEYISAIIKFNNQNGSVKLITKSVQTIFSLIEYSQANPQIILFNAMNLLGYRLYMQGQMLHFNLFLDIKSIIEIRGDENVQIWQNSLIYREQLQAKIIRQVQKMSTQQRVKIDKLLFNIDELGIILAIESNHLLFISIDSLTIQHKISVSYGEKLQVRWQKKDYALIIIRDIHVDFYFKDNLFKEANYSITFPKQLLSDCITSEYHPQIVCDQIGIFDFILQKWEMNSEITIENELQKYPTIIENEFFILIKLINESNKYIVFDQIEKTFSTIIFSDFQNQQQPMVYLQQGVQNQIIVVNENDQCGILSMPGLSKLFYQKMTKGNGFKCFYNYISSKLIIRTFKSVIIYNIPYKYKPNVEELDPFEFNRESQFILTQNYIFTALLQNSIEDNTKQIKVQRYNINNGTSSIYKYVLTNNPEMQLQYWEEKEVLFNQKVILQISDMQFGWVQDEMNITGYSNRYNYFYGVSLIDSQKYLTQIDVSESFMTNSDNSNLLSYLKIENTNLLISKNDSSNNQQEDLIVYFDLTTYKSIQFSLKTLQQKTLFNVSDNFETSLFKTKYSLHQIKDQQNKELDYIILNMKCKIFIYLNDQLIQLIDLYSLSKSCDYHIVNNTQMILASDQQSYYILNIQNQQVHSQQLNLSSVLDKKLIQEYNLDPSGTWLFLSTLNESFLSQVDLSTNEIIYSQGMNSEYSLVEYIDNNSLKLISLGDVNSHLQLLLLQSNKQPVEIFDGDLNCGKIKQIAFATIDTLSDTSDYKLLIYITCQTRISLISGVVNSLTNEFSLPLSIKIQQLLRTRFEHTLKSLNNKLIAVFSSIQTTIYSLGLQYICHVEESFFKSLSNILLAPDGQTFFLTDSDAIYIYRISSINSDGRLILQDSFKYIIPQIYSIEFFNPSQPYLLATGVDINGIFQLKYLPQQFSDEKMQCYYEINNYSDNKIQNEQYLSFLQEQSSSIQQIDLKEQISLSLIINEFQKNIQLPVQQDFDIDYSSNPFIIQRILFDVDLSSYTVSMSQYSKNSKRKVNLLKSIKVTQGTLNVTESLLFDNMDNILFRNIQFIFSAPKSIKFVSVKSIKFDNCTIQRNFNITSESVELFQFESVDSTQIIKLNVFNQQLSNTSLFSFQKCSETQLQRINISNITQEEQTPLVSFNDQTTQIFLYNVTVSNSTMSTFVQFLKCREVKLENFKIINLKTLPLSNQDRILSYSSNESLNKITQNKLTTSTTLTNQNNYPFMIAQYITKNFTLNGLDIGNQSELYQFLNYQNWYEDESTKVKRQTSDSKIQLKSISVLNTTFYNSFVQVEEFDIEINQTMLSQSKQCTFKLSNATKLLYIESFNASSIQINSSSSLLQITDSLLLAQKIYINNSTSYKTTSDVLPMGENTSKSFVQVISSDFIIDDLQGNNNNINGHFLTFQGNFISTKNRGDQTQLKDTASIVQNSKIANNFGGGGIKIVDLANFTLSQSSIIQNYGTKNGGGVHAINTQEMYFISVEIAQNRARQYGGGVYLENSDLFLTNSEIYRNSASIGGGIRYNNDQIYPKFLDNPLSQLFENRATIFGDDYGSFPSQIRLLYLPTMTSIQDLTSHKVQGVRSAVQQFTTIGFQIFGEDGELVYLPSIENLEGDLKNDLLAYYQFILSSANDTVQIQQQSITSTYNYQGYRNRNSFYTLEKHIIATGFNNLQNNFKLKENEYPLGISSISNFKIPENKNKRINVAPLSQEFILEFRDCQVGEVVRWVQDDFYECQMCDHNTYSFANPYSNNLQNVCQTCIDFASLCQGDKIVPQEGFWIEQNTNNILYCSNSPSSCTQRNGAKQGCSEGYYGPLCESCDYYNQVWKGKTYAKTDKFKCSICSENEGIQIVIYVLVALVFLLYLFYQIMHVFQNNILKLKINILRCCNVIKVSNSITDNQKSEFALKILICYFQIISIIFQFSVQLPSGFKVILFFGSNIDITLYSIDCFFNTLGIAKSVHMIYLRLIWSTVQPILYLIVLMLIFCIFNLFSKKLQKIRNRNLLVSAMLQVYFMLYPSLIHQSVGSFSCKQINSTSYVLNDLQFPCYDQQYYLINFCLCLPLIIICIAIPLIIMRKLLNKRNSLEFSPRMQLQYGYFFSEYKQEYSYWEIVKLYLKIVIFIITGVFNENLIISSIFITLLIIIYLNYLVKLHPYTNHRVNILEYTSMISAIVTIMGLAIISRSIKEETIFYTKMVILATNIFFFGKFLSCFSSHFIRKPKFRVVLQVLNRIQSYLSFIFPKIEDRSVNIVRVTKNWNMILSMIQMKSLQQLHSYNIQDRVNEFIELNNRKIRSNAIISSSSLPARSQTERRMLTQTQLLTERDEKYSINFNAEENEQPITMQTIRFTNMPGQSLSLLQK